MIFGGMAVRVYEVAKQKGLSNKDLIALLKQHGHVVSSHMAVVTPEQATLLEKILHVQNSSKSGKQGVIESAVKKTETNKEERIGEKVSHGAMTKDVVHTSMQNDHHNTPRKHGTKNSIQSQQRKREPSVEVPSQPAPAIKPQVTSLVVEQMNVAEFAQRTQIAISDVILTLLKQGIVSSRNQVLSHDIVEKLATKYGITPIAPPAQRVIEAERGRRDAHVAEGKDHRSPVIVIMGHVDHGKTTLLDTIRQTRVAAREKGGITQHLGAYVVMTQHGAITFLDTPGHEAFSMIRARGVRVADIAILVVAADDGIKPQTLEALRIAQESEIPIIVALNKIDRASAVQIEKVKQELAQRGLVPEEWGGQTIIIPLSAKFGQGIDILLETIALQAGVMELMTDTQASVVGIVIESRVAKGLGNVGTVISRQGILRVGDYFVAGATEGRITALMDEQGKRIREVYPSVPVSVAGFYGLPRAGDVFTVVSSLDRDSRRTQHAELSGHGVGGDRLRNVLGAEEDVIRMVVKADTASSLEALIGSLKQIAQKAGRVLHVVQQGVGHFSERDIVFASDTGAIIYGLHVRLEPGAASVVQQKGVKVHLFDIIYTLLDDVALRMKKDQPIEKVVKKVGEAIVLKVFDIKKMGVVAGAQVKSGIFSRDGVVKIYRSKRMVGEGHIKSLQRDRKAVKEVHNGFECAFMVTGFEEWQVDDRVECYLTVDKA